MGQAIADAMRTIMLCAVDGTEAGVAATEALMSDDLRMWQQGTGWVGKADKVAAWSKMRGAPMPTQIHSLLACGDEAAVEAVVTTPGGAMLVTVFARFRDGRMVGGREYFLPAPPAEVFGG